MSRKTFWRDHPVGRYYAAEITGFLCHRFRELGVTAEDYLAGEVDWRYVLNVVFEPRLVLEFLQPRTPHLPLDWWMGSGTGLGKEEVGDWARFFRRGRGPLNGWLQKCMKEEVRLEGGRKTYVQSLCNWPGRREPFGPVHYDPATTGWSNLPGNFAGVPQRVHLSKEMVVRLLVKSGYRCAYCCCRVDFGDRRPPRWPEAVEFQIDHIAPLARYGDAPWVNDLDNFQVLCVPCNLFKGGKDHTECKRLVESGRWNSDALVHLARGGRGRMLYTGRRVGG